MKPKYAQLLFLAIIMFLQSCLTGVPKSMGVSRDFSLVRFSSTLNAEMMIDIYDDSLNVKEIYAVIRPAPCRSISLTFYFLGEKKNGNLKVPYPFIRFRTGENIFPTGTFTPGKYDWSELPMGYYFFDEEFVPYRDYGYEDVNYVVYHVPNEVVTDVLDDEESMISWMDVRFDSDSGKLDYYGEYELFQFSDEQKEWIRLVLSDRRNRKVFSDEQNCD